MNKLLTLCLLAFALLPALSAAEPSDSDRTACGYLIDFGTMTTPAYARDNVHINRIYTDYFHMLAAFEPITLSAEAKEHLRDLPALRCYGIDYLQRHADGTVNVIEPDSQRPIFPENTRVHIVFYPNLVICGTADSPMAYAYEVLTTFESFGSIFFEHPGNRDFLLMNDALKDFGRYWDLSDTDFRRVTNHAHQIAILLVSELRKRFYDGTAIYLYDRKSYLKYAMYPEQHHYDQIWHKLLYNPKEFSLYFADFMLAFNRTHKHPNVPHLPLKVAQGNMATPPQHYTPDTRNVVYADTAVFTRSKTFNPYYLLLFLIPLALAAGLLLLVKRNAV